MNVKTLTHSQQQPQAPKAHKKKSTVRLTYRVPQRSLLYRFLVLDEDKYETHTQQQRTQLKTQLRLVNLTENAEQHTFKAPCCCFESAPNTDLLFFRQSMQVLIVIEIKYLIYFLEKYIQLKYQTKSCFVCFCSYNNCVQRK